MKKILVYLKIPIIPSIISEIYLRMQSTDSEELKIFPKLIIT